MSKPNTMRQKPNYTLHRFKEGSPIVVDSTTLADFRTANPRGDIDCAGWDTIRGFVKLTGGTSISIQPTELVKYRDKDGSEVEELINVGSAIAVLGDGDSFDVTVNQGRFLLNISAVVGVVTLAKIFLTGAQANDIEHRGGARRY